MSGDEMAGRHQGCNEHELGRTSEDGEGQGGLACCNTWGLKESDMTGQLNKILITEHRFICFWLITGTVNIFGSVSKFFLCYIE